MSTVTLMMLCDKLLEALVPKFIAINPKRIKSPNVYHTLPTCYTNSTQNFSTKQLSDTMQ